MQMHPGATSSPASPLRWSAALLLCLLAGTAHAQVQPTQRDVVYARIDGKDLKLDVYSPPAPPPGARRAPGPVLLRFSAQREGPAGAANDLLAKNYVLVYAGYLPGEPARGTVFSKFPQDLQAAKAAVRWVRGNAGSLGVDPQRIGLWGSGSGATIAALAGLTADQKNLDGALGEFRDQPSDVRALCLFEGVTDWRNAELYGDETVNIPNSPAYQLFGGNIKDNDRTDLARQASAVNYVRPTSPATLMITRAGDDRRAMHQIFAETLRKAGVRSALYEESTTGAAVDEKQLNDTVLAFFADTLGNPAARPQAPGLEQEIDQLARAGLYKQARRLIEEQLYSVSGDDAEALKKKAPWLALLRQITEQQQAPALKQLQAARQPGASTLLPDGTPAAGSRAIWTIREVLTDPERIGQYTVEPSLPQRIFDSRADAMRFVELLNSYIVKGDAAGADRQAGVMQDIARRGDADPGILNELLARFAQVRGRTLRVWPAGVKPVPYAADFGQDLYGFWMDIKSAGATQRMRYIPPGRFAMGSAKDEWGRLPGEPILEPTDISRGFWLGDSEVTQGMYEAAMGENRSAFRVTGNGAEVRAKLPAENVSYAHAVAFLNHISNDARLPTEAEWEYACRAGSAYMYSGTGRLSDMGWFWDEAKNKTALPSAAPSVDARGEIDVQILHELETDRSDVARLTHPVKQKLPNRWGLYDMQGNVWEWCTGTNAEKPRDYHPARGGSWLSIPQSCRAARDVWLPVEVQSWNVGMRICIPAQ